MAQALPVYAVAALLLVASAGPITRSVRDASLADFEALDEPRPLDSFPFLKQVRAYLPPLVVEWLIVKQSLDLPEGGDFRVDDDGRIVVVWPDGCEETHKDYLAGSTCDADPCNDPEPDASVCGDPCLAPLPEGETRPSECDPDQPPLECPGGQLPGRNESGEPACIPDPDCDLPPDHPERPAGCPAVEPPPPPPPRCDSNEVEAYDGTCILVAPRLLLAPQFGNLADNRDLPLELKVPYENMSLVVRWEGLTQPQFQIKFFDALRPDQNTICWNDQSTPGGTAECTVEQPGPLAGGTERRYSDATSGAIRAANYTLSVDYQPAQPDAGSRLFVYLYGKPLDAAPND